jgi:hypothetical protein
VEVLEDSAVAGRVPAEDLGVAAVVLREAAGDRVAVAALVRVIVWQRQRGFWRCQTTERLQWW